MKTLLGQVKVVRALSATAAVMAGLVASAVSAQTAPRPHDLGTLGGGFSSATDINDKDQVVGESFTASDELHAFRWEKGHMKDLGTLGGPTSRATGINHNGEVVGSSSTKTSGLDEVAFLWKGSGPLVSLGKLPGDRSSQANDINDHGDVVGRSGGETFTAAIWHDGHVAPLPGLSIT
jgi:probable HAF family extracellular repeat protein